MTRSGRLALVLVAGVAACFHPSYDHAACSASGACPPGWSCQQGVCERDGSQAGSPGQADAAVPQDTAAGQSCWGSGLVQICLVSAPTQMLAVSTSTVIDTSSSAWCMPTSRGGDGDCVIVATEIAISAPLRATGAKPLVMLASGAIRTAPGGLIDVGSHRVTTGTEVGAGADPASCGVGTPPVGGGGGAGGSFMGRGGAGGAGGEGGAGGTPAAAVVSVAELRGGCPGQDGQGATGDKAFGRHGGGAVYLIAGTQIDLRGGINAAGEGGDAGNRNSVGGGGGGAGGMIGLDAPSITSSGLLLASGGGGGEGSDPTTSGAFAPDPSTAAAGSGGAGNTPTGGDGGSGSPAARAAAGSAGQPGSQVFVGSGGGGGGGGGAGLIKAPATATLGTNVSPPATP